MNRLLKLKAIQLMKRENLSDVYNYVAYDSDGSCWLYKGKPRIETTSDRWNAVSGGDTFKELKVDNHDDWKDSLTKL
jgi:hypothetical protein